MRKLLIYNNPIITTSLLGIMSVMIGYPLIKAIINQYNTYKGSTSVSDLNQTVTNLSDQTSKITSILNKLVTQLQNSDKEIIKILINFLSLQINQSTQLPLSPTHGIKYRFYLLELITKLTTMLTGENSDHFLSPNNQTNSHNTEQRIPVSQTGRFNNFHPIRTSPAPFTGIGHKLGGEKTISKLLDDHV